MRIEPGFGESPKPYIGAVVKAELSIGTENGDRRGESIQRVGMGIDVPLQPRFGIGNRCNVGGGADDTTAGERTERERKGMTMPAEHSEALGLDRCPLAKC